MQKILLAIAILNLGAIGALARDDRFDPTKHAARTVGKIKIGAIECTAFLSGDRQITTSARCIRHGVRGGKFSLGLSRGRAIAESELEEILTTGGGFEPKDVLRGTAWAHIRLKEPLGTKTGAWLDLAYTDKREDTPLKVKSYGYGAAWEEGEAVAEQSCELKAAPKHLEKDCDMLGGEIPQCRFFVHECSVDPKGLDEGGPMISAKTGRVVAINVGRITREERVSHIALMVSDYKLPAANPAFHWALLRLYDGFDFIAKYLERYRTEIISSHEHRLFTDARELLRKWPKETVQARFRALARWNLGRGQDELLKIGERMLDEIRRRGPEENAKWTVNTKEVPAYEELVGKYDVAPYYAKEKPVDAPDYLSTKPDR